MVDSGRSAGGDGLAGEALLESDQHSQVPQDRFSRLKSLYAVHAQPNRIGHSVTHEVAAPTAQIQTPSMRDVKKKPILSFMLTNC